jgi:hypothetical protein
MAKQTDTDDRTLYEEAGGSPVKGYLLLKSRGKNVPPAWVERYEASRQKRQARVKAALDKGLAGYGTLLEWEEMYQVECFYYGIRVLFELERAGKTKL